MSASDVEPEIKNEAAAIAATNPSAKEVDDSTNKPVSESSSATAEATGQDSTKTQAEADGEAGDKTEDKTAATSASKPATKPASKLNAGAKTFSMSATAFEFKPKAAPAAPAAAAAADAGMHKGGAGGAGAYNAQANEFVPNGYAAPGPHPGQHPGQMQPIISPNGMPIVWSPQLQSYVPVHFSPHMMQGNMYQQPPMYGPGNHMNHGGYQKQVRGPVGGNYNHGGSGHQSHHHKQHNHNGNGGDKSGASGDSRLPEAGAIRFGSLPPSQVTESSGSKSSNQRDGKAADASTSAATATKPDADATKSEKSDKSTKASEKEKIETPTENRKARSDVAASSEAAKEKEVSTGTGAWGKERLRTDKDLPFQRGQTVSPTSASQSPTGGGGGWKRGESMPYDHLKSDDTHTRYDKGTLVSLYSKGKTVPPELKAMYPEHSTHERTPLLKVTGNRLHNKKNKQDDLEPHPDEAEIFDFSKKENAFTFQKDRLADDTDPDVICSKANLILNKLSVTKFDKLSDDFMSVGLASSEELLRRGVDMIVLKAQMEEHFCFMYADLCKKITELWTDGGKIRNPEDDTPLQNDEEASNSLGKLFRQKLLQRCQEEFQVDRQAALEAISNDSELNEEDKEEKEILLKKRYTGHMRFIGELYLKDLVTAKIMHGCITELLTAEEEGTLVCLCKLLVTIGSKLENYDNRKRHDYFTGYFERINEIMKNHPNSRMRFMLRDLVDQRQDGWVARREEERAMDMAEIRGGKAKPNSPRQNDVRNQSSDEWTTVATSKRGSNKGSSFKSSNDVRTHGKSSQPSAHASNTFSALGTTQKSSPIKKQSWTTTTSSKERESAPDSPVNKAQRESSAETNNADAEEVPGADGTVTKEMRDKVRSIIGEYYMNDDTTEALTTFKEVIHPNALGEVIGQPKGCIDFVFEKHPSDVTKLCKLLESLHMEKFLTMEQVRIAVNRFLDNFDDTVIDSPRASEYGSAIIACLIADGLFNLSSFADVPEDSMWHMSYRRAAFMGDLLTALIDKTSEDNVQTSMNTLGDKLDVLSMVLPEPKQSEEEARNMFLAKYPKLAFLKKAE